MSDDSGTGTTGGAGGNPPPGWYPAGEGPGASHRWWDGTAWTEHTGGMPGDPDPGASPAAEDEATRVRQRPIDLPPGTGPAAGAAGASAGAAAYPGPAGFPAGPDQAPRKKGPSKVLLGAIAGGVLLVVVIVVVVLALTLGGGGGSAQEVAEDFTQAITDGDIPAACELVDEGSRDELLGDTDAESCDDLDEESIPGFSDLPDGVSVAFDLGEVTEDGDTATGDLSISATYDGDDDAVREQIEAAPATDGTIELSREDGDWVVSDFN